MHIVFRTAMRSRARELRERTHLAGRASRRLSLGFPTNHQPPQVIPRPINEMIVLADDLESTPPKLACDGRQRHLMSVIRVSRARTPINNH